jgi:hypothetical protein
MAQLTFQIPDARMPEVTEAYGRGRGWLAEVADPDNSGTMIPNPETEAKYAKNQIMQDIQTHVKHYQGQQIAKIPIS